MLYFNVIVQKYAAWKGIFYRRVSMYMKALDTQDPVSRYGYELKEYRLRRFKDVTLDLLIPPAIKVFLGKRILNSEDFRTLFYFVCGNAFSSSGFPPVFQVEDIRKLFYSHYDYVNPSQPQSMQDYLSIFNNMIWRLKEGLVFDDMTILKQSPPFSRYQLYKIFPVAKYLNSESKGWHYREEKDGSIIAIFRESATKSGEDKRMKTKEKIKQHLRKRFEDRGKRLLQISSAKVDYFGGISDDFLNRVGKLYDKKMKIKGNSGWLPPRSRYEKNKKRIWKNVARKARGRKNNIFTDLRSLHRFNKAKNQFRKDRSVGYRS